ncbi:MAG: hypothetical protein Q7U58_20225, partial [Hydrogenophaga sp.]|nr:hypothetical protein [Hydrogenophaga sp.]
MTKTWLFRCKGMRVMLLSRLSAVSLCLVGSALVLSGCANTKPIDETAGWSPNKLYSEARDE